MQLIMVGAAGYAYEKQVEVRVTRGGTGPLATADQYQLSYTTFCALCFNVQVGEIACILFSKPDMVSAFSVFS